VYGKCHKKALQLHVMLVNHTVMLVKRSELLVQRNYQDQLTSPPLRPSL
jgi:hypothetical protein